MSGLEAEVAKLRVELATVTKGGFDWVKRAFRLEAELRKATEQEAQLRGLLAARTKEYEEACALIARMHAGAVGEVCGPIVGVVEDVETVRRERDQARAALKASEEEFRGLVARHDETLRKLDAAQVLAVRLEADLSNALRERDAATACLAGREKHLGERIKTLIASGDLSARAVDFHAGRATKAEARVAELEREVETLKGAVVDGVLELLEGAGRAQVRGFNEGLELAAAHVEARVGTKVGNGLKVVSSADVAAELRAKKVAA